MRTKKIGSIKRFSLTLTVFFFFLALSGCATREVSVDSGQQESNAAPTVPSNSAPANSSPINVPPKPEPIPAAPPKEADLPKKQGEEMHFSKFDPIFRFSAKLPDGYQVEYVKEIRSLNIFDPNASAPSTREKSQIFIRFFQADRFLTLGTVNILSREDTTFKGHAAVRYEIEKKKGVPSFPGQPSWRNGRHKLIDIRLSAAGPTTFYVFTYSPSFPESAFDTFLNSIVFDNDRESFRSPMDRVRERITKKPFGITVSPGNSPVSPERFSGYHTAADFEVFDNELNAPSVEVRAFCGGKVLQKRSARGYGGVVVQECMIRDQAVTIIYGHVRLASITAAEQAYLTPGAVLGSLGTHASAETDHERRHLHFGIHKGGRVDIRGYVPTEQELANWLNPLEYLL